MPMCRARSCRSSAGDLPRTLSPRNRTSPPTISPGGEGTNWGMLNAVTDLPQPVSPTRPITSPRSRRKSTPTRTFETPSNVRKLMRRSSISTTGPDGVSDARLWIEDIPQPVAQHAETEDRDKHGEPRKGRIPPELWQELAPVGDHLAPLGRRRLRTHPDEPEGGQTQDREAEVHGCLDDHARDHVGQDVEEDDPARPGTDRALRLHVVLLARRLD